MAKKFERKCNGLRKKVCFSANQPLKARFMKYLRNNNIRKTISTLRLITDKSAENKLDNFKL